MKVQKNFRKLGCAECAGLDFSFTMAFQPIVDIVTGDIFAHEALVRGVQNESAAEISRHVNEGSRYRFDQACRVKAIQLASQLAMPCYFSINFMPNAVYRPELCIRTTLEAAERFGFPIDRLIFEITEGEQIDDMPHLREIVRHYQQRGFLTAIDDFGAGYSGLNLLAEVHTDLVKLDMALIRNIDQDRVRRSITHGIVTTCRALGCELLGEGVETVGEYQALREMGITLFQGYLFAKPALEALPVVPDALWESIEPDSRTASLSEA